MTPSPLTKAHYGGKIHYCQSISQADFVLRQLNWRHCVVGFDTEFRRTSHIDVLQLSDDQNALVLHISGWKKLPESLVRILRDSSVVKACQSPFDEVNSLQTRFGLEIKSMVDVEFICRQHLNLVPYSLKALTAILLNQYLDKTHQVTNWSRAKLTEEQITYAATDAYISLKVLQKAAQIYAHLHGLRYETHAELLQIIELTRSKLGQYADDRSPLEKFSTEERLKIEKLYSELLSKWQKRIKAHRHNLLIKEQQLAKAKRKSLRAQSVNENQHDLEAAHSEIRTPDCPIDFKAAGLPPWFNPHLLETLNLNELDQAFSPRSGQSWHFFQCVKRPEGQIAILHLPYVPSLSKNENYLKVTHSFPHMLLKNAKRHVLRLAVPIIKRQLNLRDTDHLSDGTRIVALVSKSNTAKLRAFLDRSGIEKDDEPMFEIDTSFTDSLDENWVTNTKPPDLSNVVHVGPKQRWKVTCFPSSNSLKHLFVLKQPQWTSDAAKEILAKYALEYYQQNLKKGSTSTI